MDRTEPIHVALPRSAWIAAGLAALLLLGMLGTLVAVLISLEGTRSEIRTTRRGVLDTDVHLRRVTNQLSPVLSAVAPLTSTSSTRTVRRTGRSLVAAAARVPAIGDDAHRAADAAGYIGQTLQDAQLAPTLTAVRGLASDGHQALPGLSRLIAALDAPGPQSLTACTTRLRVGAPAQPGQLGCALRFAPDIRSLLVDLRGLNTHLDPASGHDARDPPPEPGDPARDADPCPLDRRQDARPGPGVGAAREVSIGRLARAAAGENRCAPPSSRVAASSAPPPGLHKHHREGRTT